MARIRTEISIESSESFVVKRKRFSIRYLCTECEKVGIFVRPTEAGFLAGLDLDTIVSSICSGELHVCELPGRGIFVCLTSLCMRPHAPDQSVDDRFDEVRLIAGYSEEGLPLGEVN